MLVKLDLPDWWATQRQSQQQAREQFLVQARRRFTDQVRWAVEREITDQVHEKLEENIGE